jgi:hypothetical protein
MDDSQTPEVVAPPAEQTALVKKSRRFDPKKSINDHLRTYGDEMIRASFEQLLKKAQEGSLSAVMEINKVVGAYAPAPMVSINNNNIQMTHAPKSKDRSFEGIVELLEKKRRERPASDVNIKDAEFTDIPNADPAG